MNKLRDMEPNPFGLHPTRKFMMNYFCFSDKMKVREPALLMMLVFFFFKVQILVLSRSDSAASCVLDIHPSLYGNISDCKAGKWSEFVEDSCCGEAFDDYLYALAKWANQTQRLFLNSTEQNNCLVLIKDVLGCNGINKLTSGAACICCEYTINDVVNNLGNKLIEFDEDCKFLGSAKRSDQACNLCSKRWEEIVELSDTGRNSTKAEAKVCSLASLVTVTSTKVGDKNWIQALYQCLGDQVFPTEHEPKPKDNKKGFSTGLWILAGGIAVTTAILLVIACLLCKKSITNKLLTGKDIRDASDDSQPEETSWMKITRNEVYSATDNLNASNFIGQGVAGKVYKGILSNGKHVAVKHIIKDGHIDTFIREVRSLSNVRHPNLVALLGYCEDKEECFLVYELCHNGNVSEWLFGKDKFLPWIHRLKIATDSAKGVWFLHSYPEGCIVHRDIKPTNILINATFQAKLSDFGLSKVMDLGQSYVSSEVRGTFGYVDPEYRKNHRVNASGDVYSFGIVLLQLLSGRRVIDLNLYRPMPHNKMARLLTGGGKIEDFADPRLNGEYSMEAFDLVFKLALSCTGFKQQRPSMEQVVLKLEKALNISTKISSVRIERTKTFSFSSILEYNHHIRKL